MPSDFRRRTEGAALVEAALVLPILLLLVFGAIDLSLYFWQSNLAAKAAQLGVRKATISASVAAGPGLTRPESTTYWDELTAGARCAPDPVGRSPCPSFSVRCGGTTDCVCTDGVCPYRFERARLQPIYEAMRAVLPQLRPEQVEIGYATNGGGYVGRPVPVPVDVTVRIVGLAYEFWLVGPLAGWSPPIRASATLPGEDLLSN